ncbi:MAG: aminodeoxychorismate lyase [Gammaproteobacteria bacterium]
MSSWVNGRKGSSIDARDRGLQYGDGVFETMRVCRGEVRLLQYHLERLYAGCRRLEIKGPARHVLQRELEIAAARCRDGVLKLIVTRGPGARGYRPTGLERCTRVLSSYSSPRGLQEPADTAVRVRLCTTPLGQNPRLAGLKTLNRLESVLARAEWRDARIWEGLMRDMDENIVCGTMSNLFLRTGSLLLTPVLDRCGVAGVMRRWILRTGGSVGLQCVERCIRWQDLITTEEVFLSNAVVGLRSVDVIQRGSERLKFASFDAARQLRTQLDLL